MTGNTKVWRAPLAGLAAVAMLATMGVAAGTANAAAPEFTVKFDANGRGDLVTTSVKANTGNRYKVGNVAAYAPTGVSADWTFTGWYTSAKLGEGERFNTQAPVLGDVTLYAHWAKTTDVKTVEVADNAGVDLTYADVNQDNASNAADASFEVAPGDKLSEWMKPADNNPADGHKLTGFEDADGKAFDFTQAVTDDVDITATAKDSRAFIVKGANLSGYKYNHDADGDGTNDSTALEVVNGQAPKLPAAVDLSTSSLKLVSKWLNDGDGQEWKGGTLDAGNGNYVDWTVKPESSASTKTAYSVDFQYDGGQVNLVGDSAPATRYVEAGKTLGSLPEPNLYDGKLVFDGWNVSGTQNRYYGEEPVTGNVTLAGTFSVGAVQYTVTFDPNYTGSTPTQVKYADGATVAKPDDPTRDGYVFAGWYNADPAHFANSPVYKTAADFRDAKIQAASGLTFKALWLTPSQAELKGLLDETGAAYDQDTQAWTDFDNARTDIRSKANYELTNLGPNTVPFIGYKGINGLSHVSEAAAKDYIKQLSDLKGKLTATNGQFVDVFNGNNGTVATPHSADINFVAKKGISTGYGDGTFKPTGSMFRQDYAAFLYRLAGSPEYTPAASDNIFTDVTPATPHYKEILWAAKQGIIKGFADGTFRGLALVNRQDAAAFLYRAAGSPEFDASKAAKTFTDVNESTPHYKEVLWAANTVVNQDYDGDGTTDNETAIIQGFNTGTFDGYATLLRQDGAAFLARTYFYINK